MTTGGFNPAVLTGTVKSITKLLSFQGPHLLGLIEEVNLKNLKDAFDAVRIN